MGRKWTVSEGPDPDRGEPFLVMEEHDTGMVSFYMTRPGPVFVTPEIAEHVRIRLGAAITASREHKPPS